MGGALGLQVASKLPISKLWEWKVMHENTIAEKKNNGNCHIILSKNYEIDDSLTGIPKRKRNWNKIVRK